MTVNWSIYLPEQFARRVEDGSLVLWRPGLTLWLAAWGNDHNDTRDGRLSSIKQEASPDRFAEHESEDGNVTRYSYRLRDENENGPVDSISSYIISDLSHLQMAAYFDDPGDVEVAWSLIDSVSYREHD